MINNNLNIRLNNIVIDQKLDNALAYSDYSLKNALLWGNCKAHFQKGRSGNWRDHKVHLLIAAVQLLPIIGQIASIFEAIVVKIIARKISIEERKMFVRNVFQQSSKDLTDFLIDYATNPDLRSEDGHCPLIQAVLKNDIQIIKMLIHAQVNLNDKDNNGYTALMWAAINNQPEVIQILIDAGADLNIQNNSGQTALMIASAQGKQEIVQILANAGADLNIQNNSGQTALMLALHLDKKEIVQILANAGANLENQPPLVRAILKGDIQLVNTLIESQENLDYKDINGSTALIWALFCDQEEIVQILVDAGADLNTQNNFGQTALMIASAQGKNDIAQILIDAIDASVDFDIQDNKGQTALMIASANGNQEIVEILDNFGADLNIQDNKGQTALMIASGKGNQEIVQILVNAGADLNIKDNIGYGALMIASAQGKQEIVQILVNAGAAFHTEYQEIVQILTNTGTELNIQKKFKETVLVKAVGHSTSLEGIIKLRRPHNKRSSPFYVFLEGGTQDFYLNKMYKATQLMHENHPTVLAEEENNLLGDTLLFSSNQNTFTTGEIVNRIQEGFPVILRTGYSTHAVSILVWGSYFIICNRGGNSRAPVEIFQYDQEKLDKKTLQEIIECSAKNKEDYQKLFFETLPQTLNFRQEELEKSIQEKCPLPYQVVGNCSWFSPETAVWALLVWKKIRESEQPNVEEIIQTETQRFNSWLVFNQLYHLERYMSVHQLRKAPEQEKDPNRARNVYKIDTDLIRRAFESSFSIKDEEIDESIAEQRRLLYDHFTTNF